MTPRLASAVLVSALIRQVEIMGGNGAILAKGDPTSGALFLLITHRGRVISARERGFRSDGQSGWMPAGPADQDNPEALSAYVERRRRSDPDLWVVELDGIAVETIETMLEAF